MRKSQQEEITVENVINNYMKLTSSDPESKFQANIFLCNIPRRDEAWDIAQSMITNHEDPNFKFLGAQILYQKVCLEIRNLTPQQQVQLRMFVFTKLQDASINSAPCIDKLASVGALIGCVQIFKTWPSFINDLFTFMTKSEHNLRSGLFVLQRIPQQLRVTNRLGVGQKNAIVEQILKNQTMMAQAFSSILNMDNPLLESKCLQAIQSWAKSQYNFLKYPEIIKKVLALSEENADKFEIATSTTVQSIKGAVANKYKTIVQEWSPVKQFERYGAPQIQSIKGIVLYLVKHKNYFTSKQVQPEHVEAYLEVIKQSLLNFGFIMAEPVGFELVNVIKQLTKSQDLRTSQNTFGFWMDFMSKMSKCNVQAEIKNPFIMCVTEVFQIISKKVAVNSEQLLNDPDLKQQVTIDDLNAMSWDEYRKLSSDFYQSAYDYFLQASGSANFYFERCFEFIGNQESSETLGAGTQLALFCVKAPIQSMISDADAQSICKLLRFVISKGDKVYPRIIVQALLLIRDCTREMKRDSGLITSALNYAMFYLNNQKICFYAAQAFKSLMETLTTISDRTLVSQLLTYYSSQTFSNEHIVDKIIQGICTAIIKMQNPQDIGIFMTQLAQVVLTRFQTAHKNLKPGDDRPYFVSMLQMKTILDNFEISGKELSQKLPQYPYIYFGLLKNSLKMVSIVLPYCLKEKINYVKFNELGLSCSMYKLALNVCQNQIEPQFLSILEQALTVLTKEQIVQKYPLMELLCFTMTYFVKKNSNLLSSWLMQNMPFIDNFFIDYMRQIALADADVVRAFFEIQEGLVLYNCELFLKINNPSQIFDRGLYILRHLNQTKMQRKVVNFLLVCCSNHPTIFSPKFPQVVQTIISSIPIISGVSVHNVSRMFMIVSQGFPNMRQFLTKHLQLNPYEGLSQGVVKQLVNLILLTIQPNPNVPINIKQRCLMMIIKELNDLAKNQEPPNKALQLQIRYNQWKKNRFVTNEDD